MTETGIGTALAKKANLLQKRDRMFLRRMEDPLWMLMNPPNNLRDFTCSTIAQVYLEDGDFKEAFVRDPGLHETIWAARMLPETVVGLGELADREARGRAGLGEANAKQTELLAEEKKKLAQLVRQEKVAEQQAARAEKDRSTVNRRLARRDAKAEKAFARGEIPEDISDSPGQGLLQGVQALGGYVVRINMLYLVQCGNAEHQLVWEDATSYGGIWDGMSSYGGDVNRAT